MLWEIVQELWVHHPGNVLWMQKVLQDHDVLVDSSALTRHSSDHIKEFIVEPGPHPYPSSKYSP